MGLDITFGVLGTLPAEEAVPYLEEALAEPYPEIQTRAFDLLIGQFRRLDIIAQNYPALSTELRNRVHERKNAFLEAARVQLKSRSERARRAGYEIVAALGEGDAAFLLAQGVSDPSHAIRETVTGALEKIALQYHVHLLNWQSRKDEESRMYVERNRGAILETLDLLLRSYPIHRKDIFIDVAIETGGETYRLICNLILSRTHSELYEAFLRVMQRTCSEAAIDMLFRLLHEREERIQEAAIEVFRRRKDAAFLSALADYFSRIPPERYEQLASRMRDLPWWEALAAAKEIDSAVVARHIAFLCRSAVAPTVRERILRHFLAAPVPGHRAAALLALKETGSPALLECARASLEDPSDTVRFAAAKCIVALDPPDKIKLLTPSLQSADPELRKFAMREIARTSFDRYMASFDRLDAKTRELAARAISKIDVSILDRLAEEVNSLDADRRLKALQILDYAEMGKDAQSLVREVLNDPDRRVRATAIKLLQMTGNTEGIKQVIHALSDPDRRVRANAIEAFEEIGDTRFSQLLLPFCQDPDNRVRANAAKALWNLGRRESFDVLRTMLEDGDETMRLSAVWAAGEIGTDEARDLLVRRLQTETAEKVRGKLLETVERLQGAR